MSSSGIRTALLFAAVASAALWMMLGRSGDGARGDAERALEGLEAALLEGRFAAVERGLRELPPASLPDAAARLRRARLCVLLEDPEGAADSVREDARGEPARTAEARFLLAEALVRSGRPEAAQEELAALERAGLKDERWQYVHALLNELKGESWVVASTLEPLIRARSTRAEVHVLWAQQARSLPKEVEKRLLDGLAVSREPGLVRRALGRHFLARGDGARAAAQLEEAVRARPWDREARLALVRARRLAGLATYPGAEEVARALIAEDPADLRFRLALAETLGAWALEDPDRGRPRLQEALALYEAMAKESGTPAELRMSVLLGLARTHVEMVSEDPDPAAPGSHLSRVDAVTADAEALDPEGRFRDPWDVRLTAEAAYLRGRAWKRAHIKDDQVAVGHYMEAFRRDPRHLETTWDLGLLYYDFFRSFQYQKRAMRLFSLHIEERKRRGLPALDVDRMKMVWHNWQIVTEMRDRGDAELTPPDQKEVPMPRPFPGQDNEVPPPTVPGGK